MNELLPPWLSLRRRSTPVFLVFAVGFGLFAIDQVANPRAGPVPVLVTAPLIASLAYVRNSDGVDRRQFGFLVLWSFLGTALALLFVVAYVQSGRLPEPATDVDRVVWDTGLFLWFVLALSAAYGLSARWDGKRAGATAVVGPLLQAAYVVILTVLVDAGLNW